MTMRKIHMGVSTHRFLDNPEERRFALAWERMDRDGRTLAYLLDPKHGVGGFLPDPSDRDYLVAATMMQWLGSPVGQGFLRDIGYERKPEPEPPPPKPKKAPPVTERRTLQRIATMVKKALGQ